MGDFPEETGAIRGVCTGRTGRSSDDTSNIVRLPSDGKETKVSENAKLTPSAPTGPSQQGAAAPASIDIPRVVIVRVPVATSGRWLRLR